MSGDRASGGERSVGIDALRGIAVLAVMLTHLPFSGRVIGDVTGAADVYPSAVWGSVLHFGQYGVHLFLVISGFAIHFRWAREADRSRRPDFVAFWRRRLTRLYPPFILMVGVCLVALFAANSVLRKPEVGGAAAAFGYPSTALLLADVVMLVLLLQNFSGASQRMGNGPFWSLALEEQLYLLYFPLLWLRRKTSWLGVLTVVTSVSVLWRLIGVVLQIEVISWALLGPGFWLAWALGALAAEVYWAQVQIPVWARSWTVVLLLLGIAVVSDLPLTRDLVAHALFTDLLFGAAFFVLINAVVHLERSPNGARLIPQWLVWVGGFSYSIYLTHNVTMVVTKQVLLRHLPPALVLGLRVVVPLAVAWAYYRLFEVAAVKRAQRVAVPWVGVRANSVVISAPPR